MSEKEDQQERHPPIAVPALGDLLTEGQRRSLGTVLRRVEWAVWQMEELLMQDDLPDLALTQVTHLPDSLQQDGLLRLARCVRQNIELTLALAGIVGGTRNPRAVRSLVEENNDGERHNDLPATGEQRGEAPSLVDKEEHS